MSRLKTFSPVHVVAAGIVLVASACGPTELPTPSASQAETLIGTSFPDARVRVREVTRDADTLRIPAEFNEADVVFVMAAQAEGWGIGEIEQGGNTYTVEQLNAIAQTMETMRQLSNGLEAYKEATGGYPVLDDLVGLREIVPAYYPAEASMEDAWTRAFRYRLQGDDYTITSTGPDGEAGNRDDVILITGRFVSAEGE